MRADDHCGSSQWYLSTRVRFRLRRFEYHLEPMESLQQNLDEGWRILRAGTELLRSRQLTPDEVQLELYSLAFGYSYFKACEALIDYRLASFEQTDSNTFELVDFMVRWFLAHALDDTCHQLSTLLPDSTPTLSEGVQKFVRESLAPSSQARMGQRLFTLDKQPVPDLLGHEMQVLRESIRRVTDAHIAPQAQRIHRENLTVSDDLVKLIGEMGCFGLSVPTKFGGAKENEDEGTLGMVVMTEELSRGSLGAAGSLITRPEILVRALLEGGTEEQRRRWLPGVAVGNPLCAISVTEPGTGSDVASVALKATRHGAGWRLNGSKTWCTLAGKAGLLLVLARTDANASPPHRGLSLFVVEKPSTDGHSFEVSSSGGGTLTGRSIGTIGYRGMHSFEMFYDDFFVPHSALVGEDQGLNRGFYYTMQGFSAGRLQTAARATGLMQAAYEETLAHCNNRIVFGKPLAQFPISLSKLGRMATYIAATRQLSYIVARHVETEEGQVEASLVKLMACRFAEWVTREAVQLHGGMGYAEESPVSRLYVDARVLSIFEGAEETLAVRVIGKSLLDGILS